MLLVVLNLSSSKPYPSAATGRGVSKTTLNASAPYIKALAQERRKHEELDENVKVIMQRLDEETREGKIIEEKLLHMFPVHLNLGAVFRFGNADPNSGTGFE